MSVELLDNTRRINSLLQEKLSKNRIIFNDICRILSEVLKSNVLVLSKKGKLLGYNNYDEAMLIPEHINVDLGSFIDKQLNGRILNILSTKENVNLEMLGFSSNLVKGYTAIVTPVLISGDRLGSIFIYRNNNLFSIDDIIISEYGATVIGLETMRSEKEEIDQENQLRSKVERAIASLSCSELDAIKTVLKTLDGHEGIIIASKISESIGITRSIIVNALRKFESAGIIEAKSSGMKGTFIKVTNEYVNEIIN